MDLWIRSQDRTFLINVKNVFIDEEKNEICTIKAMCTVKLGSYISKERALEVLDEIHRLINDLQYISYAIPNKKFVEYKPNVYEMPKE